MKVKTAAIVLVGLILFSCQKHECECTTVFYDSEGLYIGSEDDIKHIVKNDTECKSYNKSTPTESTNCSLDH